MGKGKIRFLVVQVYANSGYRSDWLIYEALKLTEMRTKKYDFLLNSLLFFVSTSRRIKWNCSEHLVNYFLNFFI